MTAQYKGRAPGRHSIPFLGLPLDLPPCVYVVELSNGMVKVGWSNRVRDRLTSLSRYVVRVRGACIRQFAVFPGVDKQSHRVDGDRREKRSILALGQLAQPVPGTMEYFRGIAFDDAVAIVRPIAEIEMCHRGATASTNATTASHHRATA